MKAVDLTHIKHQLVTMPIYFLAVVFIAGWIGKPWLADQIGFVTTAQAAEQADAVTELSQQVGTILVEIRMEKAFRMIRTTQQDLAMHNASPDITHEWRSTNRRLEHKAALAKEYKTCIQNAGQNCDLLQNQLWQ